MTRTVMDQNPHSSESYLNTATAVAASLSEDATTMWQHYTTVQACEPHLRVGQEPIITAGENHESHLRMGQQDPVTTRENCESHPRMGQQDPVTTGENPNMKVGTVGGMGNGQTITIGEKEEGISLAAAALVPLPRSSSPTDSQQTSPTSSCFITPASTPSRSPSPPRHSPLHPSQQATLPHGEFVDGCQDNEQDNGNHSDGPFEPHSLLVRLPTMIDAETQTHYITAVDSFSQTHATVTQDSSTNTEKEEPPDLIDVESQTDGNEGWEGERREVGCNTKLQISPELLERAQLAEELVRLRSEQAAGVLERNEAKSQQMVAEELSRIVQSELVELRQRNIAETTTRVRLENQLGGLKVELSSSRKEAREKEERITELEETLKGTSLLVRKLEEQNAVSLMNRGGIDYMLQAKLADARAQEAEQKLEVAQTELLHSQGEVKRLLDRVGVATRDRSEMVSSKVHNQLLQIADERAQSAEQKALQLERQLLSLRDQYGHPETSHPSTFTRPSTYTSTLGGYPSFSSTLLPPYTSSSPYSLSTSLSTHLPPSTSFGFS
ncbi:hypothetical protein GBAR_LOCUS20688 [Geodia barretti]|uniref:Uncharacterized protein n=1 Tax=Geodia barretti TaxID=519541 RepID=A0AA35SX86_GEOBA|nr:hypothetical protein GBAR_LOCUS20688 [Geodia barretti]